MKPFWYVENFHADNGTPELLAELKKQEIPHKDVSYIPFDGTDVTQFDRDKFIFVGSINLAERIMKAKPELKHNFWCSFENYDCSVYLPQIGDFCLNGEEYIMIPFHDIKRQKWQLYRHLGEESHVFIRPNAGYKEFTGALVDFQNVDHQMDTWEQYVRPNSIALISKPVNIVFEWRVICASYGGVKEVVAASLYKFKGEQNLIPNAPPKVIDFAQEILYHLDAPDPMFCVDIAETKDGRYKVVEINAFSTSGHYKADKKKIIEVANEIFCESIRSN